MARTRGMSAVWLVLVAVMTAVRLAAAGSSPVAAAVVLESGCRNRADVWNVHR